MGDAIGDLIDKEWALRRNLAREVASMFADDGHGRRAFCYLYLARVRNVIESGCFWFGGDLRGVLSALDAQNNHTAIDSRQLEEAEAEVDELLTKLGESWLCDYEAGRQLGYALVCLKQVCLGVRGVSSFDAGELVQSGFSVMCAWLTSDVAGSPELVQKISDYVREERESISQDAQTCLSTARLSSSIFLRLGMNRFKLEPVRNSRAHAMCEKPLD